MFSVVAETFIVLIGTAALVATSTHLTKIVLVSIIAYSRRNILCGILGVHVEDGIVIFVIFVPISGLVCFPQTCASRAIAHIAVTSGDDLAQFCFKYSSGKAAGAIIIACRNLRSKQACKSNQYKKY